MFFLKELPSRRIIESYTGGRAGVDGGAVERALRMMRNASLLIRALEAYFSEHRLSQLRFLVLIVIDREEARDSLQPYEIAQRIDVSRPVMTRTLKGMVEDGLLEMRGREEDARAKDVSLTDAGRETLNALLPGYFRLIMDFMDDLEAKA